MISSPPSCLCTLSNQAHPTTPSLTLSNFPPDAEIFSTPPFPNTSSYTPRAIAALHTNHATWYTNALRDLAHAARPDAAGLVRKMMLDKAMQHLAIFTSTGLLDALQGRWMEVSQHIPIPVPTSAPGQEQEQEQEQELADTTSADMDAYIRAVRLVVATRKALVDLLPVNMGISAPASAYLDHCFGIADTAATAAAYVAQAETVVIAGREYRYADAEAKFATAMEVCREAACRMETLRGGVERYCAALKAKLAV